MAQQSLETNRSINEKVAADSVANVSYKEDCILWLKRVTEGIIRMESERSGGVASGSSKPSPLQERPNK